MGGLEATALQCAGLFCIVLTKATPGYAGGEKELIARGGVDKKMVPYAQALLLARYLRGDLDGYPPFLWK